jgi:hypothetical protein
MAFVKGQSGNPGGRPKEDAEVKELAREHGPAAIRKLAQLMECGQSRTEAAAAIALLDRGFGKPQQDIAVTKDITYRSLADEDIDRRIAELSAKVGTLGALGREETTH